MAQPADLPSIRRPDDYQRWIANEGLTLIEGLYIEDLKTVQLGAWERRGGRGAVALLQGSEDVNDAHIIEIPAGGQLTPEKHMYEELVFVVSGRGTTSVWNGAGAKTSFEWQEGSLFSVPLNAWSQHFNSSGSEPARFYVVTSAPLMMKLIHNLDFIYNCEFDFTDRFSDKDTNTTEGGTAYAGRVWDTRFIPDVRSMQLKEWSERGAGGSNVMLEIADSSLCGHISQFPVGTYKKAHRHGAGAHVIIISGQGFSLLWREDEPVRRVDWKPGSIVVPPDRWFHQHFNTGSTPARYLAMRWGSQKYPVFKEFMIDKPTSLGGDQIEYVDEDPSILAMFEAELERNGVPNGMRGIHPERS
ncbi:MAG: hypothetical protein JWR62_319 [Modestobacter sp.]|jgi:mannose-6-phosphate isomerase-like protein (cupin superfamily)|nr:hypothetical protein [Modestobacter sp.]